MSRLHARLDRDLALIFLSLLLWGVGAFLYMYIQPLYITQLGATPEQVGLTLGLGGLVTAALYAPIGLWADRRGRKTVIVAGWVLGTLAAYGFALAPDWRWFIPAMAAYTLSNFAVSVLNGYIASKTDPEQRAFVYALIAMGFSAGSIAAPAIGGWIGEVYGLRAVYLVAALVYTLSTLTICFIRPQPIEPLANASNARAVLRNRLILTQIVFMFALFFAADVGLVFAPKFLAEVRGLDVAQIGWLGTVSAVGVLILAPLLSRWAGGNQRAIGLGQLLTLVSLALLSWGVGTPQLFLAFLIGGGNRLVRPPTLARFANLLTPSTMSFGLGLQQTATQIGLAFSPYVAGVLYSYNPLWPFGAGMVALSITLALTLVLPGERPPQSTGLLQPTEGASG